MKRSSSVDLVAIGQALSDSLQVVQKHTCFGPMGQAIFEAFQASGIPLKRLQIPMMRHLGFRHPVHGAIVITVVDGKAPKLRYVSHSAFDRRVTFVQQSTPYREVMNSPGAVRVHRVSHNPEKYAIFDELNEQGLEHYAVASCTLANGAVQPFSISSPQEAPFPDDLVERVSALLPLISMGLSAAYQIHVSHTVATTYLGEETARRVLVGEIRRGSYSTLDAGIAFCDIRGFTRMSEQLGALETVRQVNRAFEVLEEPLVEAGGEILKFIGDAMLVVFAIGEEETQGEMIHRMNRGVEKGLFAFEESRAYREEGLRIGIGLHAGEVLYGNVGTPGRLDFTVMGPAVNLAARLESHCSQESLSLVCSETVAAGFPGLIRIGEKRFKGVSDPVLVYGRESEAPTV